MAIADLSHDDQMYLANRARSECGEFARLNTQEALNALSWNEQYGGTVVLPPPPVGMSELPAQEPGVPSQRPGVEALEAQPDPEPVENAQVEGDDAEPESRGRLFR
jgi:hypothetical protein